MLLYHEYREFLSYVSMISSTSVSSSAAAAAGCPWKWTHLNSVNFSYGLIFIPINLVFFFLVLSTDWIYKEHILLHMESLTTTRPGVWLPTSCMLCAHERFPENDEPPKIYSKRNIFFCFSVISQEWMTDENCL